MHLAADCADGYVYFLFNFFITNLSDSKFNVVFVVNVCVCVFMSLWFDGF